MSMVSNSVLMRYNDYLCALRIENDRSTVLDAPDASSMLTVPEPEQLKAFLNLQQLLLKPHLIRKKLLGDVSVPKSSYIRFG